MCNQCAARQAVANTKPQIKAFGAVEPVPFAVAPVSMLLGVLVGIGAMWFLARK